jgi:squalene-hopene/tetraprenyl-beta-curcumene cyclase
MIARATRWLLDVQNGDGSWGGARGVDGSIEETALAVEALARSGADAQAIRRGLAWLQAATSNGQRFPASPLGLYFARLWYSEELYPIIFTAAACEAAGNEDFVAEPRITQL